MKRQAPTMSADDLRAWRERHQHSLNTGADALGVTRRTFADYLAGANPIPRTVELLAVAIDRLEHRKRR